MRLRDQIAIMTSRMAINNVKALNPSSCLELGCSRAVLTRALLLDDIPAVASDLNPKEEWMDRADAQALPYPDNSFDLVVTSNMLEHIPDGRKAIQEMARVGNRLWLSWTPWWGFYGLHDWPLHWIGIERSRSCVIGETLFKTTVKDTLEWLNEAGFEIKTIRPRYYPWLGFLTRWKWTREWATWNVEVYAIKKGEDVVYDL